MTIDPHDQQLVAALARQERVTEGVARAVLVVASGAHGKPHGGAAERACEDGLLRRTRVGLSAAAMGQSYGLTRRGEAAARAAGESGSTPATPEATATATHGGLTWHRTPSDAGWTWRSPAAPGVQVHELRKGRRLTGWSVSAPGLPTLTLALAIDGAPHRLEAALEWGLVARAPGGPDERTRNDGRTLHHRGRVWVRTPVPVLGPHWFPAGTGGSSSPSPAYLSEQPFAVGAPGLVRGRLPARSSLEDVALWGDRVLAHKGHSR